ncbi:MAG: diaminopimelate epimerase [Kiritimatiellia bacterium]
MRLHFLKMHGAANDFVMIDDREGKVPWQDHFLMAALACRRTGVGCEGIILIQKSDRADFRMRFLNPDGTEVGMCGNGSRCAAAFAHRLGVVSGRSMTMETASGLLDAEIGEDGAVRVWMPEPDKRKWQIRVPLADGTFIEGDFVDTGVPHFVVEVPEVAKVDVVGLGRQLRLHPVFAPEGTNVDFMTLRPGNRLAMRTYERGVENESGACGTGAVACAIVAVERKCCTLPVQIRTPSGFELQVDGQWWDGKCSALTLTGPSKVVYEGDIELDTLTLENEMME